MSKIKVFNPAGDAAPEMTFADERLVLDKGAQAVKDVVVALQNGFRAGTACVPAKGEIAGSNKKPWKQKGTGNARAGYRQSNIWRGGYKAMGPKPRDYSQKVNRKVVQLAFTRALSEKIKDGQVAVIETLDFAQPKTKLATALLKKLGIAGKVLVIGDELADNVRLAFRNLPKVSACLAAEVDTRDLLYYTTILATKAGFEALTARMLKKTAEEGA